jgi:hypothetical protein
MAANDQQHEEPAADPNQQANPDKNATPPAPAPSPEELVRENARLAAALKETNRKAAADRKYREDREEEERKRKDQELPEVERLKAARDDVARKAGESDARAERAEAELVRLRVDIDIERLAGANSPRFTYPDLVSTLIDHDRIEFDEDTGRPINLAKLVRELAEKRPALLDSLKGGGTPPRTPPAPRQGGNNANPNGQGPTAPDRVSELRSTVRYGF